MHISVTSMTFTASCVVTEIHQQLLYLCTALHFKPTLQIYTVKYFSQVHVLLQVLLRRSKLKRPSPHPYGEQEGPKLRV